MYGPKSLRIVVKMGGNVVRDAVQVAAVGACGANVDPNRVSVRFESSLGSVPVLDEGEPLGAAELKAANAVLQTREVRILVTLGLGPHSAEAWGCDLSEEYVTFNSAYST